jgi:phosphoserine phosphatase
MKKNKKLVIFTTTYKSQMGGIKDLLLALGKKEVIDIDKEYQWRKLFGPWGGKEIGKLYQGFSEERLKKLSFDYYLEHALPGLRELIFTLKEKGFLIGVTNYNPQFMMDVLKEQLPLDFAIGSQLEFKDGIATGKIKKGVDRYVEVEILKKKRKEYGLSKKDVISLGRASITHLPIAKESGIYIGFDPVKDSFKEINKTVLRILKV